MKIEREHDSDRDRYIIGIEIDKLCIKASLVDSRLKPVEKVRFFADNVKAVGSKCADLVEELIKKSGIRHNGIGGVGIGADARPAPIAKKIEKKFNTRTFYAGAAACGALGEVCLNPEATGIEYVLYIYSDLGNCAVLKGGNAEVIPQEVSGYLRPWDASFGITAIAKREVERGVGTKIAAACEGRIDRIDDAIVLEAARQNDEVAVNIIHNVGVTLGMRAAYLINLVGPQAVILGGNLEKAGGLLIEPIKDIIKKLALKSKTESLKMMYGKLGEDAVCLGAASLAIRKISCSPR